MSAKKPVRLPAGSPSHSAWCPGQVRSGVDAVRKDARRARRHQIVRAARSCGQSRRDAVWLREPGAQGKAHGRSAVTGRAGGMRRDNDRALRRERARPPGPLAAPHRLGPKSGSVEMTCRSRPEPRGPQAFVAGALFVDQDGLAGAREDGNVPRTSGATAGLGWLPRGGNPRPRARSQSLLTFPTYGTSRSQRRTLKGVRASLTCAPPEPGKRE